MNEYKTTIRSGYIAYGVQAISNNFAPLLFLTFHSQFGIPLKNITFLITLSFVIQLLVDLLTVFFVDKIVTF